MFCTIQTLVEKNKKLQHITFSKIVDICSTIRPAEYEERDKSKKCKKERQRVRLVRKIKNLPI